MSSAANGDGATIPLGKFVWERIHQVGVDHIFGVPGDFNLTLLDHIYNVEGLKWVGNTNELNAAYAADGYARVKGASCLVTTHGVGELSALNAIAGAMTEEIKVIHVVGQTSLKMQQDRMMIHHSIGANPDHQIFNRASKEFRVAAAELQTAEGAAEEIDRALRECFIKSGPVYLFVPIDLVDQPVPAQALKKPLNLKLDPAQKDLDEAAKKILDTLSSSKNPAVYVDCLVQRHQAVAETAQLLEKLRILTYTSVTAKGLVDEKSDYYVGVYAGLPSCPGIQDAFKTHDAVLVLGNLPADTNSGGFTGSMTPAIALFINPFEVKLRTWTSAPNLPMKTVLAHLTTTASNKTTTIPQPPNPRHTLPPRPLDDDRDSTQITQSWLWHRLAAFMHPHDVVLGETGTTLFGIPDTTFPYPLNWHTQTYYGSIGFATAATMGAALAQESTAPSPSTTTTPPRTILLTGDGSLMLTAQEIANMIKQNLSPVLIILNNAGYTIERVIHGAHQSYNDIVPFNYAHLLPFFGMDAEKAKRNFARVETKEELEGVLGREAFKAGVGEGVRVLEVVVPMLDTPWRLTTQLAARGEAAVREMRDAGFKVR